MVSTFIGLLDIQSWWEIPCIAHFCSLFSSAFNLPDIDIEDLESALLTDGTDDTVGLLPELIVSLLHGIDVVKGKKSIVTTSNYQMFLRRCLRYYCRQHNTENYFDTDTDFQSLPLRNKLLVLYSLCHFRLESGDVQPILSNLESDSLRVEPLGYDSKNSSYWYFYGTRLYREDTKSGSKNTVWQVICFTEEDWQNLATKFQNSSGLKERALYNILAENFLPKLPQLFRERERLRRKKLLQVRTSVRIRGLAEEKQKVISKEETEEIERQKLEERLKLEAVNKLRSTRTRRRSQSSSTASGISTYASSIRASTNSSDFLYQREKFCLSPDVISSKTLDENAIEDLTENNINEETVDRVAGTAKEIPIINGKLKKQKVRRRKNISKESDHSPEQSDDSFIQEEDKENNCLVASNSESELSCADSNSSVSHLEMAPTTNIKLPGRQTNNSLSSLTGNIFLPTVFGNNTSSTSNENTKSKEKPAPTPVNTDNIQKKKKSKSAEVTNRSNSPPKTPFLSFTETDEVLQIGMHKVLVYVKNHRDAWPFMDPVEEDIAPRYYSIIRRPMDLLKMEEKLDNGEYAKFSDFRNDFKLIVNNCRLYNGQNNEYTEMVNNLQEAFDKATKKYFDQNSSDEEANVGYLDSKMNVFREKYFNKNNTAKVAQKEVTSKKGKEKRDKSVDEVSCEKPREEDVTEGSRANKRKRKDKDKRRKKKSKTKPLLKTDEEDNDDEYSDDNEVQDTDISDIEINHAVHDKTRSKLSTGKKMPEHPKKREVSPLSVNKKSRTKPGSSKHIEKEKDKKISVNKGKSNHAKKEVKSSKKNVKRNSAQSEAEDHSPSDGVEDQVNRASEKEFSSDNSLIDYPIQAKTHKKHSSSHHQVSSSSKNKKPSSEKTKSTNKPNKTEKENQNTKSKCKKDITSSSESAGKLKDLPKDNKINSNNNKKKKNKTKKQEKAASEESQVREGEDYESISRSPSPLFKIDLHKKYAKSASSKLEDEISDTNKKQPAKKSAEVDDLASILSRSVSRSPNRANSEHSNGPETSKSEIKDTKKKDNKKSSSPQTSGTTQEPDNKLPLFMDKYDLIKHRRNRNTDEKWNQIVKEAEKIKDNKKSTQNKSSITAVPSKEKNQKLRETIEKLKVKNAKSKERSVLIDEIFGVKPSQEIRDEKTIFEKLRETCLDSKAPPVVKKIVEVAKKVESEFDFVEELPATPSVKAKKKEAGNQEKPNSTPVKKSPTKKQTPPSIAKKSANKTNLEALELETEQTLKDINRWLEHTPRFPEFSSASNSPSRYNLLDDFDAVASKLDPNDFRRPVPITPSKVDSVPKLTETFEEIVDPKKEVVIPDLIPPIAINTNELAPAIPSTNSPNISQQKPKEAVNVTTTQLLPHPPPPPPHIKSQQQKETKRKTLKEKLSATNRRKDLLRTIDRLQPGKTKGNLISNMHNVNKPDELFPLGAAAKIKEVKNSLVVKTDETAPKLSLGSVLNTKGFGLGQLHNFTDNVSNELKLSETISSTEVEEKKEEVSPVHELIDNSEEVSVKNVEAEGKIELKIEKASATPNLSAWFKAFGAPKKSKKSEEEEKKSENIDSTLCAQEKAVTPEQPNNTANSFSILKSPPTNENFPLPAPRQRKASTGSTISERSSFSQDPDSPRIGIDDRFGAYTGPYPSPIGASPIMVSPKPEELGKPTSPYPLNGAIKVGFYQDTTTKSSPEKSCSPRELPSPYPQYSQHIYSSASSPNITNDIGASYGGCYNPTGDPSKTPNYQNATSTTLYDQYKQPQSQESDYNSSMSPGTNPNSPYQQPQNSPYQQHQNSPYQQAQNSPYQQPQNSPFQNQSGATTNMMPTQSPNSQQQSPVPQPQVQQPQIAQQQQQQCDSATGQNTPYQQTTSSSYQQPTSSPYNQQNSSSSYQQSPQPQVPISYGQQPNTNQAIEAPQQNTDHAFAQKNSQYSIHDSSTQFQQANQNQMPSFEPEVPKRPPSIINKIQTQSEWNNQLDIPNQRSQSSASSLASLNPLSTTHISQLNTPPLQSESQDTNKANPLQYQEANAQYQQYAAANKDLSKTQQSIFGNELSLDMIQHRQMSSQEQILKSQSSAVKRSQEPEAELLDLGYSDPQNNKIQKRDLEKPFDSTLNKHQQMFDSFLGSMTGKNLGFGKPLDISTSKAFEMFNRAATMGFSKDFPNSLMTVNKTDSIPSASTTSSASHQSHQMTHQAYQVNSNKTMDASSIVGANKPVNMANNTYNQQQQQIPISQNDSAKLQSFQNIHPNVVDNNKLHQQQASALFTQKIPHQQPQPAPYPSSLVQNPGDKINNELVIPNPRQDQVGLPRNQHLNMDLSNYKPTYNNPSAMLEPLRNLNHPLAMMDETMLGLQNSSAGGYYDKNIPPAHIFSKNIGQQMYQNPSPYASREQQNPGAYAPPVTGVPVSQTMDGIDPKVSKRTKKKKSSTPTPIELVNNQAQNTMLSGQSQLNLQPQPHQNTQSQPPNSQNQQGFQLYAGLKTAGNPATSNNDASAISLKTAASMVPGSAFNFGPSPTGLGLSTGIYGDNTGYLEEFRGAPNPYYIPPGHRATPDTKAEAPVNTGTPTASSYHQFLTHPQSRGSYPFMNSPQLDPNSPIYQQYLQRQEEFRARMMLNPGLLGPGTATGYPQTGYRPTLGMPKHYDMNRQSWF